MCHDNWHSWGLVVHLTLPPLFDLPQLMTVSAVGVVYELGLSWLESY